MSISTAALERIGAHVAPADFDRLVAEALEQVVPARPAALPRHELSAADQEVLARGGFDLDPLPLDAAHPIVRSAAAYTALLGSSLSVAEAAARLRVDGSRVRQRLAERTLYGIKQPSGWRLPLFQFADAGLVPGIDRVLPHLAPGLHPLTVVGWLTTPTPDLPYGEDEQPVTPLAWLAAGREPAAVAELAGHLGELA